MQWVAAKVGARTVNSIHLSVKRLLSTVAVIGRNLYGQIRSRLQSAMARIPLVRSADARPAPVVWAEGRLVDRTYLNKSFTVTNPNSRDCGHQARFVVKVFNDPEVDETKHREEFVLTTSPSGRSQVKVLVSREPGAVKSIEIERVEGNKLKSLLKLDRDGAERLIQLVQALGQISNEGGESVVLDDELLRRVASDPDVVRHAYQADPAALRQIVETDTGATDIIAIASRQAAVQRIRNLMTDSQLFDVEAARAGGPEKVWQEFLEANPWILGVSLSGQLLTSWDPDKLENTVIGQSVATVGKRVDALMHTVGRVRMLAFAEIKHHRSELLASKPYRSGCWAPSEHLSGGVVQIQQTVHLASQQIKERLPIMNPGGIETGDFSYLLRPRSYLIIGHLDQLTGAEGGIHPDQLRSFELFRRNLDQPEVITFDELLARAEWHVNLTREEAPVFSETPAQNEQ